MKVLSIFLSKAAGFYCVAIIFCLNLFVCVLLSAELWQLNRTWVFQGHGASLQPQTMLLDEGHERLYVGAKNTLFSLSLDRVNTHHREVGLFSYPPCLLGSETC